MLNPNGYENISTIMYNIGKRAKIDRYMPSICNPEWKWLFVENDGGMLYPMMKFIFNVYRCSKCEERICGAENFKAHLCFETLAIEPQYEFDWLIHQSGLLYFEMTAAKSFMNLCWEPFMSEICKELGFTTENAQAYAKKCSDHHKPWISLRFAILLLQMRSSLNFYAIAT